MFSKKIKIKKTQWGGCGQADSPPHIHTAHNSFAGFAWQSIQERICFAGFAAARIAPLASRPRKLACKRHHRCCCVICLLDNDFGRPSTSSML